MTNHRIKLTKHAIERYAQRDITKEQIKQVINNPIETIHDNVRKNYKSFALIEKPPFIGQPYLLVIHDGKFNTVVTVITVMWTDKGGLRANGFSKL